MGLFGQSKKEKQIEQLQQEIEKLKSLLSPEQDALWESQNTISAMQETEREQKAVIQQLDKEIETRNKMLKGQSEQAEYLSQKLVGLNEEISMLDYGMYRPTYDFANSDHYKEKLASVRQKQKQLIKDKKACTGDVNWKVNGSASQGRKMLSDMQKLLLRAFNSECDDIIAHVRISNHEKAAARIQSNADSISRLGQIMKISITHEYVKLKISELDLALDFAQKKEEEKERLRELRAQEREEAKAQKEIEEAKKKLVKEQTHYQNALNTLSVQLEKNPDDADLLQKKMELEAALADTEKAIADVDYRQANRRAGYVYVISNIGAFGEDVYKIGMTRRLEPMDRVNELGDASVPFQFDVHALIFTEDAPGLEAALHTAFENRKVNKINPRREFFRVPLEEIKRVVRQNFDKTVEWIDVPEAEQYRQSLVMQQSM